MNHPLARLALGLVIGLAAADATAWWLAALVLGLRRWTSARWFRPLALGLLLGVLRQSAADAPAALPDAAFREAVDRQFRGRIVGPVRRRGDRFDLVLDSVRVRASGADAWRGVEGLVRVSVPGGMGSNPGAADRYREGHWALGWARFRPVRRVPNPGSRDVAELLLRRGIVASAWPSGALRQGGGTPRRPWRDQVRSRFRQWSERTLAQPDARLMQAIVLGDGAAPADEARQVWRASGLGHLLAISGLHVGFVALAVFRLVLWLVARIPAWSERYGPALPAGGAAILAAWGYVTVAGAPVSAVRAGIMITALTAARILMRSAGTGGALLLAFTAVLLHEPGAWAEPGFQLSFSAVGALIWVTPRAGARLKQRSAALPFAVLRWGFVRVAGALVGSVVCVAATAPFSAWHFQEVPVAAVLANLVAIPLFAGLVVLPGLGALVGIVLGLDGWLGPLAWCITWGLEVSERVASVSAGWAPPVSLVGIGGVGAGMLGCGGVAMLVALARGRWRPGIVGLGLFVCAALGRPDASPPSAGELRVTFLAVGHGDSVVVQLPNGEALLVDAGGDVSGYRDVGARVVVPALRALGVEQLQAVVLSHPHPDHFLGIAAVVEAMPVASFWSNGQPSGLPEYAALMRTLETYGVPRRRLVGPTDFERGGVRFEVLHPAPRAGTWHPELSANDNSLVIRLTFGDFRLLLTGDIEGAAEARVVSGQRAQLGADVLKVPHHGSSTSSSEAFLRAVDPQLAVAQAEDRGRFAFPRPDVEARYRALGIELWVTGRSGALQLTTDGQRVWRRRW